jgi:hypothetical protein
VFIESLPSNGYTRHNTKIEKGVYENTKNEEVGEGVKENEIMK